MTPIQGELQIRVMDALWRLGTGTVEDVRNALPPAHRSAYTTVQTVLNRLVERGLLARVRRGQAFVYEPAITEADYVSRVLDSTLSRASPTARQFALAQVIGHLDKQELSELQKRAKEIAAKRRKR